MELYGTLVGVCDTDLPPTPRKAAIICGQKFNSPSGVPKLAMIYGQKLNSPSCVVRKLVMISSRKSNHPSCVARMVR